MKLFVISALLVTLTSGSLFNKGSWDGLKVTYNFNPFANDAYAKMPQETSDCSKAKFQLKDSFCQGSGTFVGYRYWQVNDPSVMLIFDVNGYIAGIQTGIPKDQFTPSAALQNHPYIEDGDYWTLTVYFVETGIICAPGRSKSQFKDQGNGYKFFIQNGTNPSTDLVDISLNENDLNTDPMTNPLWGTSKCNWGQGNHYWYKVTPSMDCSTIFPFYLLYNSGVLNAFGFFVNTIVTSARFEETTSSTLEKMMQSVPECYYQDPNYHQVSSMHVYLTDNPLLDLC